MNQYDGCGLFAHMVNRELVSIGSDIRIHAFDSKFKNDRIIDILENDFRRKNRPISKEEKWERMKEKYIKETDSIRNDPD